jgi:nucleotide-binding universal stress UspA family protein
MEMLMKMDVEITGRKTSAIRRATQARRQTKQKKQTGFKNIVVPIDFSDTSIKALDYALALAEQFGSRIHLVHVLEFPEVFNSTSQPSYAVWDKDAKKSATSRLDELVDEKVDELITVNSEVRFGRAHQTICEAAREQKADLIVIGTHGFTGLKHLLLGSTAERVIRHAPCSVLAVRKQTSRNPKALLKPKKILVPTDFSKPAEQALHSAIALAKQYRAKIHLLYVVPTHYAVGDYEMVDYAMLAAEEKTIGQKRLGEISKGLRAKKISVSTQIQQGRPAVEINQAAAELECDLIVISTQGRTGWSRMMLGSTTEEVVRHSSCPVLAVKNL